MRGMTQLSAYRDFASLSCSSFEESADILTGGSLACLAMSLRVFDYNRGTYSSSPEIVAAERLSSLEVIGIAGACLASSLRSLIFL